MFLLIVTYTKPIESVTPHVQAHVDWVNKYINEKVFLFAGPKKDKNGGAILTKSMDRALLNKIIAEDSYVKANVCDYQLIDFDCKVVAPGLELLTGVLYA